MTAPSSRPVSPWCKSINEDGAAAGSIASRRNGGPRATQSLGGVDGCSGLR
jgi:hypothetical protein